MIDYKKIENDTRHLRKILFNGTSVSIKDAIKLHPNINEKILNNIVRDIQTLEYYEMYPDEFNETKTVGQLIHESRKYNPL